MDVLALLALLPLSIIIALGLRAAYLEPGETSRSASVVAYLILITTLAAAFYGAFWALGLTN